MDFNNARLGALSALGLVGGVVCDLLGGWDMLLQALLLCMAVDYATGLIVAGVFHKSPKTENGRAESSAGLKGIFRKVAILLAVCMVSMLDYALKLELLRSFTVCFFIANEGLSIIENLTLMGVELPSVVKDALEVLKKQSDKEAK